MKTKSLLAMALGMAAASGLHLGSIATAREPRLFTSADAERLAKAEAKLARKAARREKAKEGHSHD